MSDGAIVVVGFDPVKMGSVIRARWPADALQRAGYPVSYLPRAPERERWVRVVLNSPMNPLKPAVIRSIREECSAEVWLSEDDHLWRLPSSIRERWGDHFTTCIGAHERALPLVRGVVVSTPALLDLYEGKGLHATLARNRLPRRILEVPARPQARRLVWTGSIVTHAVDLRWLAPAAPAIAPDLHVIGDEGAAAFLGASSWAGWTHTPERYWRRLGSAWAGIVPLAPLEFNEAKSYLKGLEYASLGIPFVAAPTSEYRVLAAELAHRGAGDGVILAGDPHVMAEAALELLGWDADRRGDVGARLRAAAATMVLEEHLEEWWEALSARLGSRVRSASVAG